LNEKSIEFNKTRMQKKVVSRVDLNRGGELSAHGLNRIFRELVQGGESIIRTAEGREGG